jgi:hypothetical protein
MAAPRSQDKRDTVVLLHRKSTLLRLSGGHKKGARGNEQFSQKKYRWYSGVTDDIAAIGAPADAFLAEASLGSSFGRWALDGVVFS